MSVTHVAQGTMGLGAVVLDACNLVLQLRGSLMSPELLTIESRKTKAHMREVAEVTSR